MMGLAGRGARHRLPVAGGEILLIDESYNANPASMAATIDQLGSESAGRRVAILGSMKELGAGGEAWHADLAAPLAAAGRSAGRRGGRACGSTGRHRRAT